jgi:hypothetical protein
MLNKLFGHEIIDCCDISFVDDLLDESTQWSRGVFCHGDMSSDQHKMVMTTPGTSMLPKSTFTTI